MSSDEEIDDLQRFEASRDARLQRKAGLNDNQFQAADMSDEEVLALQSDSDSQSEDEENYGQEGYYEQDDKSVNARRDRVNDQQDDNWGLTRDNYFGGEDDIGESEGASEEEEQEALRLRERELAEMEAADFVDEDDREGWKTEAAEEELSTTENLPSVHPASMSVDERRELIEERFPAVTLLSKELEKLAESEKELKADHSTPSDISQLGQTALNTYKGMIYSYFALLSDRVENGDLRGLAALEEHPVNEGLLMARQLWKDFQQIKYRPGFDSSKNEDIHSNEAASQAQAASEDVALSGSESEEEHVFSDDNTDLSDFDTADKLGDSSGEDDEEDEFSIAKPVSVAEKQRSQLVRGVVGDFDETADTIEQQARAKNKQSLRFYTSQIGKNDPRKAESYSGDADLPYRERDYERRQRLMQEAKRRGEEQRDVLGTEEDEGAYDFAGVPDSGLYSQMKQKNLEAKARKQQEHAEAAEAARAGKIAEYLAQHPNVDKRAINYQIEKNKGLTRKRKKENRNARVKKRVRYDQAQKKLSGVRKVYKGQEGPYQGELTGIRKNLTHSTRFKS